MSVKNILAGKEKIFKNNTPESPYFEIKKFSKYTTSEQRAYTKKNVDPLTLNFKLLIDFDCVSGLFADENNINSALAYLKRINDEERFDMLKHWIEMFKLFVKEYDFLILECTGLENIMSQKLHEFPEDQNIELKIRETSAMFIQSLVTIYKDIWFDVIRKVEVLPKNLRKFNLNIIVFSAGYYNMLFYDEENSTQENKGSINNKIYPTVRKLYEDPNINKTIFKNPLHDEFNHTLFTLNGCTFNEESGKSFIETLSNEPSADFVKNNFVINYSRAHYSGRFNNIMGDVNFLDLLILMAIQNKVISPVSTLTPAGQKKESSNFTNVIVETKKNSKLVEALKNMGNSIKNQTINNLKQKANNIIPALIGRNTAIGNIISKMTPAFAEQMIQNTVNLGVDFTEQKVITDPITKVNNMLFQNFSNNLIDIYKNNFSENSVNKVGLIENQKTSNRVNISDKPNNKIYGITFGQSNVYNKNKF